MDITITPGALSGTVTAIPSKSQAHRFLICAAFADGPTRILCPETNSDMEATADCLRSLGAEIRQDPQGFTVIPAHSIPEKAHLPCRDSGSTLRFLLPVCGALGVDAAFHMEGRLPERPLSPLWEELVRMGCDLTRPTENTLRCRGRLKPGEYRLDGGISSQFLTGLLLAFPLMEGPSHLTVTGRLESRPYVAQTRQALSIFGAEKGHPYRSPGTVTVEGDWSSGAFFLGANALGSQINVQGLRQDSLQGDRICAMLFPALARFQTVSAADIPDLIPILSVVAACCEGARFTDIRRLRLKESDRVQTILDMIHALGGSAEAAENSLTIHGTGLRGGTVDPKNDHRIAMSAAIAATVCQDPVTILGAECVRKSYPRFWEEYRKTGGIYEQYLR